MADEDDTVFTDGFEEEGSQLPRCPAAVMGTNVRSRLRETATGIRPGKAGQVGCPKPEHRAVRQTSREAHMTADCSAHTRLSRRPG